MLGLRTSDTAGLLGIVTQHMTLGPWWTTHTAVGSADSDGGEELLASSVYDGVLTQHITHMWWRHRINRPSIATWCSDTVHANLPTDSRIKLCAVPSTRRS